MEREEVQAMRNAREETLSALLASLKQGSRPPAIECRTCRERAPASLLLHTGGMLSHATAGRSRARTLASIAFLLSLLSTGFAAHADPLSDFIAPEAAPADDAEAPATIDAESSAAVDAGIAERLRGIYSELDALDGVTVDVASGIVTLGGKADSPRAADRAAEIATQVEGVVEVVEETTVDGNIVRRLETTLARMRTSAITTFAALPVLLLAVGVVALFWWLGRRLARRRSLFQALAPNAFIAELLGGVARVGVLLAGVFLALSLLDATSIIGTVLGAAGIVGLAVGFAVRDTVENWIASVLLSLRTPFVARDYVRIGEHEGAVARLTSRATILISLDGNHIRIPNAMVFKSVIVNFSRNPERRFEFVVGIDAGFDLAEASRTAREAAGEVPGVLDKPPVNVVVESLGDSNVTLTVMAWIDQREHDVRKVRGETIRFVKRAFDAAGIVMPEPIYRINVGSPASAGGVAAALGAIADPDSPVDATISGSSGDTSSGTAETDVNAAEPADESREPDGSGAGCPPPRRLRASDAADTSLDAGVAASLAREIREGGDRNLLDGAAPRE